MKRIASIAVGRRRRRQLASHVICVLRRRQKAQQNPPQRRSCLCPFTLKLRHPPPSPARIIQNLMKLDEPADITSLVHLSPPVAAAYHICLSVKGRRLDRPDVSRRMRIEEQCGGSNDDRRACSRRIEVSGHARSDVLRLTRFSKCQSWCT